MRKQVPKSAGGPWGGGQLGRQPSGLHSLAVGDPHLASYTGQNPGLALGVGELVLTCVLP